MAPTGAPFTETLATTVVLCLAGTEVVNEAIQFPLPSTAADTALSTAPASSRTERFTTAVVLVALLLLYIEVPHIFVPTTSRCRIIPSEKSGAEKRTAAGGGGGGAVQFSLFVIRS